MLLAVRNLRHGSFVLPADEEVWFCHWRRQDLTCSDISAFVQKKPQPVLHGLNSCSALNALLFVLSR